MNMETVPGDGEKLTAQHEAVTARIIGVIGVEATTELIDRSRDAVAHDLHGVFVEQEGVRLSVSPDTISLVDDANQELVAVPTAFVEEVIARNA